MYSLVTSQYERRSGWTLSTVVILKLWQWRNWKAWMIRLHDWRQRNEGGRPRKRKIKFSMTWNMKLGRSFKNGCTQECPLMTVKVLDITNRYRVRETRKKQYFLFCISLWMSSIYLKCEKLVKYRQFFLILRPNDFSTDNTF